MKDYSSESDTCWGDACCPDDADYIGCFPWGGNFQDQIAVSKRHLCKVIYLTILRTEIPWLHVGALDIVFRKTTHLLEYPMEGIKKKDDKQE